MSGCALSMIGRGLNDVMRRPDRAIFGKMRFIDDSYGGREGCISALSFER